MMKELSRNELNTVAGGFEVHLTENSNAELVVHVELVPSEYQGQQLILAGGPHISNWGLVNP